VNIFRDGNKIKCINTAFITFAPCLALLRRCGVRHRVVGRRHLVAGSAGGCAGMVDAPEWWVRFGESVRSELWMCPGIALSELLADLFVSSMVEFQVGHVVHPFYFV
jgi:hypothetical protein